MIIAGVDCGGRKVAVSLFHDGELLKVADLEVPKRTRPQELRTLSEFAASYLQVADFVWIEEPVIGPGVRASLQVAQTAGAVMARVPMRGRGDWVPVASWKKEVVGKGNVGKEAVADWLRSSHPTYADRCGRNQDRIDAVCIGLYGVRIAERSGHLADL